MIPMIDLNDVGQPPERLNLDEVRERLAATAPDWLPSLFPQARMASDKRTMRCANLSGSPPKKEGSCVIHLRGERAGWGFDHGTGESAGPIDLISYATGLCGAPLFEEAARFAHMDQPAPAGRNGSSYNGAVNGATHKPDHTAEVSRILAACQPLAGTAGERYLTARGLTDPASSDLQFHPDLTDYGSRRGWPGLVATLRDAQGAPTGGIHRTFLAEDGSGKAPVEKPKMMLGPVAGGSVRLVPIGPDGHLGIGEGIETALSAFRIFAVPTWAALSAGGLADWQWPAGTTRVTIYADAGEAGQQSAAKLAGRFALAGILHEIVSPLHGDDFNDDLRHGVTAADYRPKVTSEAAPARLETLEQFDAAARDLTRPPDIKQLILILGHLAMSGLDALSERQVLAIVKSATGIPVAELKKQLDELRRRVNATGDVTRRAIRPAWASQLRLDQSGIPERNEANVITALANDEVFAGALVFNEFSEEVQVARPLPWDQVDPAHFHVRPWQEADNVWCAAWLQKRDINVSATTVSRSVMAVAREHRIHPVRDYLNSLTWDGTERLARWAPAYLGAEDTPLHRHFGALWVISAVARIMQPGCKVDHMLILEGPQGARKSTALKILAGEEWFTDELAEIGSKDAAQQMRGVWIIEIAELDAIGRAEVSRIKAFLTRTVDRYRPPYERYLVEVPRQCVFAGSVNPDTYLRDETGNRRFWPVRCGSIDLDGLRRDRDQLWAEAVARYRDSAVWWLTDPALIAAAGAEQEARFQTDAWDELIERWLTVDRRRENRGYAGFEDWQDVEYERPEPIADVSLGEVLKGAIGLEPGRWTRADQMRVSAYLKRAGWERYKAGDRGGREWRYRRSHP